MSGRLVTVPEFVTGDGPRPLRQQSLHDLPGELQFPLELVLLQHVAMQLGVLDGHADLVGHGNQKIQVFLVEAASPVPGINLNDSDRLLFLVQDRHAHQRPDLAIGNAIAVRVFG